jgi:conjugative relaxase-like TrwC/TraI family protein
MLKVWERTKANGSARYYAQAYEGLEGKQAMSGQWGGLGAARLGLEGTVRPGQFTALANNRVPGVRGVRLTLRDNTVRREMMCDPAGRPVLGKEGETLYREVCNRRAGYDFIFSVPKTVSIVLMRLSGEERERVEGMIRDSYRAVMAEVEKSVEARVRGGGKWENVVTGNLVWAAFDHYTTRPVDGVPDPHRHTHVYCFNATYDQGERGGQGVWKAVDVSEVIRDNPWHEALFSHLLASKMMAAGYGIRRTETDWELTSVSEGLRDHFSRRTAVIQKAAEERAQILAAEARAYAKAKRMPYARAYEEVKQRLGLSTREPKGACIYRTREALEAHWESEMSEPWKREASEAGAKAAGCEGLVSPEVAKELSATGLYEQVSLKRELHVAARVLRTGLVTVPVEEARSFPRQDARFFDVVDGANRWTTKDVWREERSLIGRVLAHSGKHDPLGRGLEWVAKDPLVAGDEEKVEALRKVLGARDLCVAVEAAAGAGKTQFSVEIRHAIESLSGRKVFAFAPSSSAVEEQRKVGFAYADTLHKLGTDESVQAAVSGQVLMLDEASFLSHHQMNWLTRFAARNGCRLVLIGDTAQHHGVERGDALRVLGKAGAVTGAKLSKIYRQVVAEQRAAVELLAKGKADEGFDALRELGVMRQERDAGKRAQEVAGLHVGALKQGRTSLVVAPTHAECRRLNEAIRSKMRDEGMLRGEDQGLKRMARRNLGLAQRQDAVSYRPGDLIEFHRRAKGGFRVGDKWRVTKVEAGEVLLSLGAAEGVLPRGAARKFTVYREEGFSVAAGDRVRVTKNFREGRVRFRNNEVMAVDRVEAGKVIFEGGRELTRGLLHLDQGNAMTSYSAQGKTVDQVLVSMPVSTFGQVSRATFYVAVSRAKQAMHVFTDSIDALREATTRSSARLSPYEMILRAEGRASAETRLAASRAREEALLKAAVSTGVEAAA